MSHKPVPKLANGNATFNKDVNVSGVTTAGSGVLLVDLVPASTTNKLYNDGGTLKFNGSAVGGSSFSAGSGIVIDAASNINVYGGSGNFQHLELSTDNIVTPTFKMLGSGVKDTPINMEVRSSFQSATGSGTALLFQGTQGQLFSVTDNLSSGTIFNVSDITGLPMLEVTASGDVQIGEFARYVGIGSGIPEYDFDVSASGRIQKSLVLTDYVPATTTNALYNDGGTLKFNGSAVGGVDAYTSGIAVYASGQAIENETDISYVSGIAVYASGNSSLSAGSGITIDGENKINVYGGSGNFAEVQVRDKILFPSENNTDTILIGNDGAKPSAGTRVIAIGVDALKNTTTEDHTNGVYIGYFAGATHFGTSQGKENTAIGDSALWGRDGEYNVGVGFSVLQRSQGNHGIGIGHVALGRTTGDMNIEVVTSGAFTSIIGTNDNKIHIENTIIGDTSSKLLAIGDVSASDLTPDATLEIKPAATTDVGLIVQAVSSHSASLQEWQNSSETKLLAVGPDGGLEIPSNTPSTTTNKLYNVGGTLTFNGSAVGGSSLTAGSGIVVDGASQINVHGGTGNFQEIDLTSTNTFTPKMVFTGSGVQDTPIRLKVLSNQPTPSTSGTALSFEGTEGQLFGITDNLSSGNIFSVNDITGLPLISVDASGDVKLGEYGRYVGVGSGVPEYGLDVSASGRIQKGVTLSDYVPAVTTNTLYNNGGTLTFNGSAVGGGGGGGTVQGTDGTYDIQPTDEGATAGNTRGESSVDLQTDRSVATQVASATASTISGGSRNTASGACSTVGGGRSNTASGSWSTASGGNSNTASANYSTAGGGLSNTASGSVSTVGGGQSNTASGSRSTVGGGTTNTASGACSVVAGGHCNTASGACSVVVGGGSAVFGGNTASATYSFAGGGAANSANSHSAIVVGGIINCAHASRAFVGGGSNGSVTGNNGAIVGGENNCVSGGHGFVGGGNNNTASGACSTISGGRLNTVAATYSTVTGGHCNYTNARHSVVSGQRNVIVSPTNECCSRGATISGGIAHNSSGGTIDATTGDVSGTITCCNAGAFSTIGGGCRNIATNVGATVGGGTGNTASGTCSTVSGGYSNTSSGAASTVGGGGGNTASGGRSSIAGGQGGTASGDTSTVAGGKDNTASACASTVAGGRNNTASGGCSIVGGGYSNTSSQTGSTTGGGLSNTSCGVISTIGGGNSNTASGTIATVGGGNNNVASGSCSTVGGGDYNTACGNCATTAGGQCNTASGGSSTISGGKCNTASGASSIIGGGLSNTASGQYATVSGGYSNTASSSFAVAAGRANTASGACSVVAGGNGNTSSASQSAVLGGNNNTASGAASTVGGGTGNTSSGTCSTVGGGKNNIACGYSGTVAGGESNCAIAAFHSTVGGGQLNKACGSYSTVSGGYNSTAAGTNSTVTGGRLNYTNARHSVVSGQRNVIVSPTNECCSRGATISGGIGHNSSGGTIDGTTGDVTGTITCCNAGPFSTIGGGCRNITTGDFSSVGGGHANTSSGISSTVGGGGKNAATGNHSTVAGGSGSAFVTQTASGSGSTIGGGVANTASASYSTVAGGLSNTACGGRSVIAGGCANTASGYDSTVGGGRSNTASGYAGPTVAGGLCNTSSGSGSTVSGGYNNTASGNYSTVSGGYRAKSALYGGVAHAAGRFAAVGDAQHLTLVARDSTTDATANQVLFLDGSSERLVIPAETTWMFTIKLAAHNDTNNDGGWWYFRGGIARDASGNTSLIGSVTSEYSVDSNISTATAEVVADDTNDALEIRVTGVAAKNIRWVAVADISQVSWGTP